MGNKPRLLILAYRFAPAAVVSSVRLYYLYLEARQHFEQVSVITQRLPDAEHDPIYEVPDTDLVPVAGFDLRTLLRHWSGTGAILPSTTKGSWLMKLGRRIANSFPFLLLLGDGGLVYIWRAYQTGCRRIEENSITHLFSSYRPWADHVAAWLIKRRYPEIYWVADFRDPHVTPQKDYVVWPRVQAWFNRIILRRANLVTAVSAGVAVAFEKYHPGVKVLPNCLDTVNVETYGSCGELFTIHYSGSIYPKKQNPDILFRVLQRWLYIGKIKVGQLRLRYSGRDKVWWDRWVEQYNLGLINKSSEHAGLAVVRQQMKEASLNLVLSWSRSGQRGILTAKLYEYLAVPSAVLAIVEGAPDAEWTQIFEALQPGCLIFTEEASDLELEKFLDRALETWKEGTDLRQFNKEALRPYTREAVMGQFWSSLIAENRTGKTTD